LCIELDTLYDLIKADMVEKVEDNWYDRHNNERKRKYNISSW
jgi:hypothetical protein